LYVILKRTIAATDSSPDAVWAGFWGLFYRKFFWDFVGGTLRDPGGLQYVSWLLVIPFSRELFTSIRRPSSKAAPFVLIIVKIPLIQMLAMALGLFIIAIELPLPLLKPFAIYRSIVFRIVMLVFQTFLSILFYQVIYPPRRPCFLCSSASLLGYQRCSLVIDSDHMLYPFADVARDYTRKEGESKNG
jgi:hypothetical protein